MQTFKIYDLATGAVVATRQFHDPMEAYHHRMHLQHVLDKDLSSLVPVNPEADAAHIRLMVDRHQLAQEVA